MCARDRTGAPMWHSYTVAIVSLLVYWNALGCDFAFDDISAVKESRDLRPQTPWTQLFSNDFWGTPMYKEHSHKSYRPLCVLTLRLNYLLHELHPFGYHLFNIISHTIVCLFYLTLCKQVMSKTTSFVSALLFAVHPIHTEAVTGVVGRAETLCATFFLLAFLCYMRCSRRTRKTDWKYLLTACLFMVASTICKEQGITVAALCIIYELLMSNGRLVNVRTLVVDLLSSKNGITQLSKRDSLLRLSVVISSAVFFLMIRLRIMGSQLPAFAKFDNPAAASDTPTRQLTYNFLLPLNAWLLLYPHQLLCDWTMGTVPLVERFTDARNLVTLTFYAVLMALCFRTFSTRSVTTQRTLLLALSLMVFPFIPASNLLFPVGFVVAERILYIPSMGFCMLIGLGWNSILETNTLQANFNLKHGVLKNIREHFGKIITFLLIITLSTHSVRTIIRNEDWKNEYTLFASGLNVTKSNAKLYNNVGHTFEKNNMYSDALKYFLEAVNVQPDDIGAHMNVGRTYVSLQKFTEAEGAFLRAKNLLPRPRRGEKYQARIAPSHLNVFLNLANLISRNRSRLEEADALYRQAISMRADYIQAYINRGDVLVRLNRTQEAMQVYEKALQFDSNNADIYYNLGVVLVEQGKATQALGYFNKALEIDPNHEQALLNSAIVIQESGSTQFRSVAERRLLSLIEKGHDNERVHFNLGMLAMDIKDYAAGEKWFRKAIGIKANFRSALFNLALLLSESKRSLESVPVLKQLLNYYPEHIKGLILLGDIYVNQMKNLPEAEQIYLRILELSPKHIQGWHNLCVVYVEQGNFLKAEKCLMEVHNEAPHEAYIAKHLKIVQERIAKAQQCT